MLPPIFARAPIVLPINSLISKWAHSLGARFAVSSRRRDDALKPTAWREVKNRIEQVLALMSAASGAS